MAILDRGADSRSFGAEGHETPKLSAKGGQPFAELHVLSNYSFLRGASHPEELVEQAAKLGADFVMLSPVAATASHPDTVPLGWSQFQALTDRARLPSK